MAIYQKPANESIFSVYERFIYLLDSSDVYCYTSTDAITDAVTIRFYNDSMYATNIGLTTGRYTFDTSTGQITLSTIDSVTGILFHKAEIYYKNKTVPQNTNIIVIASDTAALYLNKVKHSTADCGRTYYEQYRLK